MVIGIGADGNGILRKKLIKVVKAKGHQTQDDAYHGRHEEDQKVS